MPKAIVIGIERDPRRMQRNLFWLTVARSLILFALICLLLIIYNEIVFYFRQSLFQNVDDEKPRNEGIFDPHYSARFDPFEGPNCKIDLVESIPDNLTYFNPNDANHLRTSDVWHELLDAANDSIDMAVFYWSLTSHDVTPLSNYSSALPGQVLLDKIKQVGSEKNVSIRIAQNAPSAMQPQADSQMLADAGAAEVRNVDIKGLVGGVLHTKFWVVDDSMFYVGSANMDFRSLTQVKELGVMVSNCPSLAKDIKKIFSQYWMVGGSNTIPESWDDSYSTPYNIKFPLRVNINSVPSTVFISSSPPPFTAKGRVDDIDAIVSVIDNAEEFVNIAVMDYFPRTLYSGKPKFWPVIDDALRRAAVDRRVTVRLMASHWPHSREDLSLWLNSLQVISSHNPHIDIQAKLFVVPAYTEEQREIPFGRVNHNKYMVTDTVAYIGTSNWSEDYFTNTAGVGLIINQTEYERTWRIGLLGVLQKPSVREQLLSVFNRDWESEYAKPVSDFL